MRIVALTLLLAACSRAPEVAESPLIGAWILGPGVHDVTHDYWFGERSDDQVEEFLNSLHATPWASKDRATEVFHANGTWEIKAPGDGVALATSTWRLLDADAHSVTFEVAAYVEHKYGQPVRRFEFEKPDLALEGRRYWIRAPSPK